MTKDCAQHLTQFRGKVCRNDRERKNNHQAKVFWLTGLSGAGKSTIAHEVEKGLYDEGRQIYVFDGDNVRHGLCGDLSFSPEDRSENIRRIAEMCKLFVDCGIICLCAFISPLEKDRMKMREILKEDYHLVYVRCPLEVCEKRDVKGYYRLAREGKIKNYTGISSPYEIPKMPDFELDTSRSSVQECVNYLSCYIRSKVDKYNQDRAH